MKKTACWILITIVLYSGYASADSNNAGVSLTERGKTLESDFAAQLDLLRKDIRKAVPAIEEEKKNAYEGARSAQKEAGAKLKEAQVLREELSKAEALVNHAKNKWIKGAETSIEKYEQMLKKAETEAERKEAHDNVDKSRDDLAKGQAALRERQKALAAAQEAAPDASRIEKLEKELKGKEAAVADAIKACSIEPVLSSGALDAKLVKFAVLSEATPRGLAEFAQQDSEHEQLVKMLLEDVTLMKEMVAAGGADSGKYGEAMQIYTAILNASERAQKPGILHRLAVGTSLEMTVPYRQRYGTYLSKDTKPVDPVSRYMHYEKAYLAGELDPDFENMSVWECRWIVGEPASNEELAWLRSMLMNYRPDLRGYSDPRFYYTKLIKTDVLYRRPKWDDSLPVTHLQEAVDKGGICHIRAWIARALARSFGIPALRVEESPGNR